MSCTHTLGSLDLEDRTRFLKVRFDRPSADIERETQGGCGGGGARLVRRQVRSYTIPMRVTCVGPTPAAAMTVRNELIAELESGVAYELTRAGAPLYLVEAVDGQDPIDVWTVFDYNLRRVRMDLDPGGTVPCDVDLICRPGQDLPEDL